MSFDENGRWDFAEAKAEHTPATKTVRICFDLALWDELSQAHDTEAEGSLAEGSDVNDLEQKIEDARRPLTFEHVGKKAWRDLLAKHPPRDPKREDDDTAELDARAGFNTDTFIPAAMAASCVNPGLTEADVEWMIEHLPDGIFNRAWDACVEVNVTGPLAELEAIGGPRRGEKNWMRQLT